MTDELLPVNSSTEAVFAQGTDHVSTPLRGIRPPSTASQLGGTTSLPHIAGTRELDSLVVPAGCACGNSNKGDSLQKVYAIGKLSFDYGTRQKREYFRNRIGGDPDNDAHLYYYLTGRPSLEVIDTNGNKIQARDAAGNPRVDPDGNPIYVTTSRQGASDQRLPPNAVDLRLPHYTILNGPQFASRQDVTALTWILKIDETPVYAILPTGPFAFETHDTLIAFLKDQLPVPRDANGNPIPEPNVTYDVERMSVPGIIVGDARLYTGETVPVLATDNRGLANWTTDALLDAITAVLEEGGQATAAAEIEARAKTEDILDRMYELTRNLGVSSHDRALNYAATDALQLQGILADPRNQSKFAGLDLDTIDVEPSPICRPDYDCWDVVITFYNPLNLQEARRGIRYTIDVSDVMPNILTESQRVFTLR